MKEHRRSSSGKKKEPLPTREGPRSPHGRHNNMYEQPWWKSGRGILVIAIILVAVIVALAVMLWFYVRKPSVSLKAQTGNPVATIPQDQLPTLFPADIPIESGAPIMSNFNAAAANGQFQATRSFQSAKSVSANFAVYDNFLSGTTAEGWKIISTIDAASDPNNASILARDANGLLTVTIAALPPQPFPATLVTITYVTNPPAASAVTATSS